ncbi:unnamed protein product [Phytophthora fragariaefolia]|uniref:Unnamed protein product n=1 Tax=Phytophthora fragariaefolia TaxID=1490495 RepID=A0A9W6YQ31_9STRA|nr:unnamed protein product [Phytophthora fragariaefolia]
MWETFMVQFSPKFIMTDADHAQYNTCSSHFPGSKILMCWFHMCQNVNAHMDGAKLDSITGTMIFRGLNDMHFAGDDDDFKIKRAKVLADWNAASALSSSCKSVADHIVGYWILHPCFSQWQAYHTPPGYASTNNPLEQYHRERKFSVEAAGDLPAEFVRVRHRPLSPYGNALRLESDDFYVDAPRQKNKSYKSIHVRRMQWLDMPTDGWLVDGRLRTCACRFYGKFAICTHVIHSTRELELPCPGMPGPEKTFVCNQRPRGSGAPRESRKTGTRSQNTSIAFLTVHESSPKIALSNVDWPKYGHQLPTPSHETTQHVLTYNGTVAQGPQPFTEVVNETHLHVSRQSPHRSASTIRSSRTYEITVPSIPAGAAADIRRSVSNVTSESGLADEPLILRQSCEQTKRRRI